LKGKPNKEIYGLKKEVLGTFEKMSQVGLIDLYYGDESGVALQPNVPYGWQFADEEVSMPSAVCKGVNCFGLITRSTQPWVATTEEAITVQYIMEQIERFSLMLRKVTVVVLDNARIHTGKVLRARLDSWQTRGLFIFYLPTYSPHLNLAETVWRKLKYEWLTAGDYASKEHLRYGVKQALWAFGNSLRINFSDFNYGLT
jgi:transposase